MKTQREIVIEVERERIICRRARKYFAWCAACEAEVEFITESEASALGSLRPQTNFPTGKSSVNHTKITADKTPLVCLNSAL